MREYAEARCLGDMPVDVYGSGGPPQACMRPLPVYVGRDLRAEYVFVTASEDDGDLGVCLNVPVGRLADLVAALADILSGDPDPDAGYGGCRPNTSSLPPTSAVFPGDRGAVSACRDISYDCLGEVFGSAYEAADWLWRCREMTGDLGRAAKTAVFRRIDRRFDSPCDLWLYAHYRGIDVFETLPVHLLANALAEEPETFERHGLRMIGEGCRCRR